MAEQVLVNLDDLRLLCCMWRQSHDISYNELGRRIGVSGTWVSKFEQNYGTTRYPYASNLFRLLFIMGYPVGTARGIVRALYPDGVGRPEFWYMEQAMDFVLESTLIKAGIDDVKTAEIMSGFRYDESVHSGPRSVAATLLDRDGCPLFDEGRVSLCPVSCSSDMLRSRCARCMANHMCEQSLVRNRGTGVGGILYTADTDHSVCLESYWDYCSESERYRVVSTRYHKILDDNGGDGYVSLSRKGEADLLRRVQREFDASFEASGG